jgi:hypothetical protein
MNHRIIGILLLFASSIALADAEVTLRWTAPTECTNGDTIGETDVCPALTRYALSCSDVSGGPYEWQWGTDATNTSDTRIYEDGEYFCVMRARNSAEANSGFSDYSNELHFTVTTPDPDSVWPNPPTSIIIEVSATQ